MAASTSDPHAGDPPGLDAGLTVVVPVHDEAHRIGPTLERLLAHPHPGELELLVVDDGSTDGTAGVLASWGDRIRVLRHATCRGKGAAVRTGVLAGTRPWVLFVDADLPVDLAALEPFAAAARRAPIVIASKHKPGSAVSQPRARRLAGRVGNLLIRALVVRGFHDTQCGFKLFRADVARELFALQRLDGFGFDFEVLYLARRRGHAVIELPAEVHDPGRGTVSVASYFAVLAEVLQVAWNRLTRRYG